MAASVPGRSVTVPLLALVAAVPLLLALGAHIGAGVPWVPTRVTVEHGRAVQLNAGSGLAGFESDGGETATFHAPGIAWQATGAEGLGNPPCLRQGTSVPADMGFVRVELPDGTELKEYVWMRCP